MSPKISVIMPVYNTKKYLSEAIESILSQTFTDFEFIIIDDCSTDWSYEILQEYEKKDNRIKLFRNEENMWVVKTRNKLLKNISQNSKYIAILDADDISEKNRLELCFDFLEKNPDFWVVSWNNFIINENWIK